MRLKFIFALCGVGASSFALSAAKAAPPLQETMEICRHAEDVSQKIAACTTIINFSHDRRTLLRAYNTRGLALCDLSRCAEAVDDFSHVLQIDSSIPGYFDNRAGALRAAGRYDEAISDSDYAISMAPSCAFLYQTKAQTLDEQGRFNEALMVVDQALRVRPVNARICQPADAGAWEFRGKVLGEMGRYSEAYSSYDRALQMDPDRWNVLRTRAETELAQGRPDAALADLLRYPDYEPDAAKVRDQIASIRLNQQAGVDRKEEAQRRLEAAQEAERIAQREQQIELARQAERQRQADQWRAESDHRQSADESAARLAILHAQAEKAQAEAELAKAQAAKAQADLKRVEADRLAAEADLARVRAAADHDAERIRAEIAERDRSKEAIANVGHAKP